jgi:anti-sigma factor RsiW
MDDLMKENLEDHLEGMLAGERQRKFEDYLAKHPKMADELAEMEESSALFAVLRLDEEDETLAHPAPGFYGRVMREVEEERGEPFWMVFLEPFLIRRLAFASLMWLALLGSYIVVAQSSDTTDPQVLTRILTQPPEYQVRLGGDLDKNRNSMLRVMLASK